MKGLLAKVKPSEPDKPDACWRHLFQVIKEDGEGLSETRVRELLNIGIRQGVIERKKFKIILNGKLRPLWHYREKKK
jgi:hypothetical protein